MKKTFNKILQFIGIIKMPVVHDHSTIMTYKGLDLTMREFIAAKVHGKTEGIADFDRVFIDYIEAVGGKELKLQLNAVKEVSALRAKIAIAESILLQLQNLKDKALFEMLKSLNFHISIPNPALDDMDKYCKQITGWIKLDVVNLMELEQELTAKVSDKEMEYSEDYFYQMLNFLSITFKVHLNDLITVREYCQWVNTYKTYEETQRKQTQKV